MSREKRVLLWTGGRVLGLILVLFVAGIAIVRTDWFRNMVREQIVAASDPPLQFTEIVSLLGSGKAPTSDPVLAAPRRSRRSRVSATARLHYLERGRCQPSVGTPAAPNRCQKLKIDPQITGVSNTPQGTFALAADF
jgi:hypothetical protein